MATSKVPATFPTPAMFLTKLKTKLTARWTQRRRPIARPPGTKGLPWIGTALEFRRGGLDYLRRMAQAHGDVIWTRFMGDDAYLISHPDFIQRVLVDNRAAYAKSTGSGRSERLLGNALQSRNGEAWLRQRRRMGPAFARRRMVVYADTITAAAREAMADWTPGHRLNLAAWALNLTLEIGLRTHFGLSAGELKETIRRTFADASGLLFGGQQKVLSPPLWVPSPRNRRFLKAMAELDDAIYQLVRKRRAAMDEHGIDLLSQFLLTSDVDGDGGMSDQNIRDELVSTMLATQQSMALGLMQSLRFVATHPAVDRTLSEELQVLGDRPPQASDLEALPWTERIIKETLRLAPPAGVLNRKVVADDTIDGWLIPQGAMVFVSQWVVHRDPRFFPDPEAFKPERWTADFERELPEFAYFPFGGGPRTCIAAAYSLLELRLLLASVRQRFRLEVTPFDPTLPKKERQRRGLEIVLHPR